MALACTTSARVKEVLDVASADTSHDTWITNAITSVSERIQNYLNRSLESGTFTEEIDIHSPRQKFVFVLNPPITSITSIKSDANWQFASADAIDSEDYNYKASNGRIVFNRQLQVGPQALQVVYAGGLAADSATLISDYPLVAHAADLQIASMFRRRTSPQGSQFVNTNQGGELRMDNPLMLLPEVREALTPLRVMRFGV